MQLDHAATFTELRNPAREAAASARERLGRFWDRIIARIASYRARHQQRALAEHVLRDIGLTRANAPRWSESHDYSRTYAAGWGLYVGTVTGEVRTPVTSAVGRRIEMNV